MLFLGKKFAQHLVLAFMGLVAVFKLNATFMMFCSMLLSIVAYAVSFGFSFAAGLVALLFLHEFGHVIAAWAVGIRAAPPVFIPFFGAVVRLQRLPVNAKMAANVAIGGPALGAISALFCIALYFWTDQRIFLVLAYTACLLNLFNLIPCEPLDGGQIGEAISPNLWWIGSFVIGWIFFVTYHLLIFCILLFSLRKLWVAPVVDDPVYYQLTRCQRLKVLIWYVGLIGVLGTATLYIAGLLL